MTKLRPLAALLLFALAACASIAPRPAAPGWYVMRHLHKAEGADPALSEEGRRCAAILAEELRGRGLAAIYVSTTRRARETAAPLAARTGLQPREYDPRDTAGLVERLRAETGPVLVVGHSNTVPEIVERLGGARPGDIADSRYGEIWFVAPGGAVTLRRIAGC